MYTARYDQLELVTSYKDRPWDLSKEIISHSPPRPRSLLDVGCGTGLKLALLAPEYDLVAGIDPNPLVRERANTRLKELGLSHVTVYDGKAESIPFPINTFDTVSVMLAPHDASEIHRVLKPGAWVVMEKVGQLDKKQIRLAFGKDTKGWRGRHLNLGEGELCARYQTELEQSFAEVHFREALWETYLPVEKLPLLLEQTPIVRDFDAIKDAPILQHLISEFGTNQGIKVSEHRYLFCAKKAG